MKDSFDWLNSLDSKKVIDFSDLDPNVVYDPDFRVEIYEEVFKIVKEVFGTFDNQFGYVDDKIKQIESYPINWDGTIWVINTLHHNLRVMVLSFLSNNKDVYEPLMLKMSDLGYRY
tara:strand:- start:168 stop:515 length:348 start_codon:yes stop_codon:yes gene_type:complete